MIAWRLSNVSSLPLLAIDSNANSCYYVFMINAIKNKYYTYPANEFFVVRQDGKVTNMMDFHKYKLRKAITPVISRLLDTI